METKPPNSILAVAAVGKKFLSTDSVMLYVCQYCYLGPSAIKCMCLSLSEPVITRGSHQPTSSIGSQCHATSCENKRP